MEFYEEVRVTDGQGKSEHNGATRKRLSLVVDKKSVGPSSGFHPQSQHRQIQISLPL